MYIILQMYNNIETDTHMYNCLFVCPSVQNKK